ncbi:DUF2953 domain-containing protein [Bacillus spongiae]|uniref:DUF2953 domain-containing protein n=1 Tax=Bacillus spongiae TaxID=2683610 RepID=A0ABU8H824_9BACI
MVWIVGIVTFIFLVIFAIIMTKLTIYISFYHGNDNDHFSLTFQAWGGLIRYKINVPLIKIDEDSASIVLKEEVENESGNGDQTKNEETNKITLKDFLASFHDMKAILEHVIGFNKIVKSFLAKVRVKNIEWQTVIGTGDASSTGVVVGGIWSMKSIIVSIISKAMKLQSMPIMTVHPSFQRMIIQTKFSCMIQFRIGQAIFGGMKIIRYWRGGKVRFKSKSLSMLSGEKHSV